MMYRFMIQNRKLLIILNGRMYLHMLLLKRIQDIMMMKLTIYLTTDRYDFSNTWAKRSPSIKVENGSHIKNNNFKQLVCPQVVNGNQHLIIHYSLQHHQLIYHKVPYYILFYTIIEGQICVNRAITTYINHN